MEAQQTIIEPVEKSELLAVAQQAADADAEAAQESWNTQRSDEQRRQFLASRFIAAGLGHLAQDDFELAA